MRTLHDICLLVFPFVIVELIENVLFFAVIIVFISSINETFFGVCVCLYAIANNVKIRVYRGRITYGQQERQQLNLIVVIIEHKRSFAQVA